MTTRRTKIVATLGPATDAPDVLERLLEAGANVVRINMSHGTAEQHEQRLAGVREAAARLGRHIAVIADLRGPKIRIGAFAAGSVTLEPGQAFTLDTTCDLASGTSDTVGITFPDLPGDAQKGDIFLLDDGRIRLEVTTVNATQVVTRVLWGGQLGSRKGFNKLGGGLSAPAITDNDRRDIEHAVKMDADYIAVSYPRSAADIDEAREIMQSFNGNAELIAKFERAESVRDDQTMDDIILASDAIMVARGDLGVEIGDAQLIGVQKRLIRRARDLDRVVITATQMMESMVASPVPTRAEVFDVANAVLDGSDAVMCSVETATGRYPVETVRTMAEVCLGAEQERAAKTSRHRIDQEFRRTDETIAMAVMYAANHLRGVKAIISVTESGATPLWMSRISSGIPIFALTRHDRTARRVALYRGVEAIRFDVTRVPNNQINRAAVDELKKLDLVRDGDLVILCKGDHMGIHGGTNSLKIVSVGNIL